MDMDLTIGLVHGMEERGYVQRVGNESCSYASIVNMNHHPSWMIDASDHITVFHSSYHYHPLCNLSTMYNHYHPTPRLVTLCI